MPKHRHIAQCNAQSPLQFSMREWWSVLKCVVKEIREDNVVIVAAGVAFFTMLAIFPLITACLSLYGFAADPVEVQQQLNEISALLPPEAWSILDTQVNSVVNAPSSGLGLGIIAGLLIALFSAGSGIRAMMQAMNIAYGEREDRNVAKFYGLAITMTISVTLFLWLSLAVIVGVPALLAFVKLEGLALAVTKYLPWGLLIGVFMLATMVVYRVGPSRRQAKFRWLIPGAIFATLAWLLISAGFSKFVAEFGTYNKTYGSLSAAIMLLIWFWMTAFVIIVGAEFNAELERHTTCDTTRGPDRPLGARGAAMADYVTPEFIAETPSEL